jgi:fatty-acyl-CoA synthase
LNHPGILEVAVVGREDPRWIEVAVAVIVNKENHDLDKGQILDWLEGKLGHYKHPREVLFVKALPRNEMRKVMKPALRGLIKTDQQVTKSDRGK